MKKKLHLACQYFLNHSLREDELRKQVGMLAAAGYECIYVHARSGARTPYFSRKWWAGVAAILDECGRRGVQFGIWDEDGYPSPVAGGRVTEESPQFRAQKLVFSVFDAAAGEDVLHMFAPEEGRVLRCFAVAGSRIADITEYCGTLKQEARSRQVVRSAYTPIGKIPAPHARAWWGEERCWALDWNAPEDCRIVAVQLSRNCGRHTVDILNQDAVRSFLRHTHETYLDEFGEAAFGSRIAACFMDEPAPGGNFPWTDAFPEEFRRRRGREILDLLPHLVLDIDSSTPGIRHAYRQTQAAMQCENFLAEIRAFCRDHRILSVGHLSRTEYLSLSHASLWPGELRCSGYLDIPCTDPLGFHVAWPDSCAYHTGLKVVASAALLYGCEQAGSDALAVMGSGATLADLMFQMDYQIAMGITYFNIHGLFCSTDGARKDEAPLSLFYQHSQWPMMAALLARTKASCERMSEGKRICEIAVFYPDAIAVLPETEAAFHALAELLLSHQKDFDLLDADSLPSALGAYRACVVPECRYLGTDSAETLMAFARAGGCLILAGDVPRLIESDARWEEAAAFRRAAFVELLPGPVVSGERSEHILLNRRDTGMFLFNRAATPFRGTVDGRPVWIPPRRGEMLEACIDPLADCEALDGALEEFELEFDDNHVPLCVWYDAENQRNELLDRSARREASGLFRAWFLLSGEVDSLKLVLEESTFAAPVRCLVNGREVAGFQPEEFYDCRNLSADIAPLLRSGSVPMLNEIRFESDQPFEMREKPYLYGGFRCAFPYGEPEQPELTACCGRFEKLRPVDWNRLGYGTYSGRAVYRCAPEIPAPGTYWLDLGSVCDSVRVRVNGRITAELIGAPFVAPLGELVPGVCRLELEVFNAPANRDRMAGRPAGLTAPAVLYRRA